MPEEPEQEQGLKEEVEYVLYCGSASGKRVQACSTSQQDCKCRDHEQGHGGRRKSKRRGKFRKRLVFGLSFHVLQNSPIYGMDSILTGSVLWPQSTRRSARRRLSGQGVEEEEEEEDEEEEHEIMERRRKQRTVRNGGRRMEKRCCRSRSRSQTRGAASSLSSLPPSLSALPVVSSHLSIVVNYCCRQRWK